jgi:sugar phosphate isomerase/epimerase
MLLGIGTYTYPWAIGISGYPASPSPLRPMGLLERAGELKVGVVQYCENLSLIGLEKQELRDLASAASGMGIKIELGTRGVEPEHLLRCLETALETGSTLVRTLVESKDGQYSREVVVNSLRAVIPAFESNRVSIAIENYEKHKISELVAIVRQVDSPCLGVCLDTVNSFGAGECPEKVADSLLPYVLNLHIKDYVIFREPHKLGFRIQGCPAGDGMLDICGLMERAGKRPGVNGILELWMPYAGNIADTIHMEQEWVLKSINYLKGLIE